MKKCLVLCASISVCLLVLSGCGSKADENKPIEEVKSEAAKMDVNQLKSMAEAYKNAIADKGKDLEKLVEEIKSIPVTELLSEKTKTIKAKADELKKSVDALKERFDVYYSRLKELNADVSGLSI